MKSMQQLVSSQTAMDGVRNTRLTLASLMTDISPDEIVFYLCDDISLHSFIHCGVQHE